jgi:hypothetical protein
MKSQQTEVYVLSQRLFNPISAAALTKGAGGIQSRCESKIHDIG